MSNSSLVNVVVKAHSGNYTAGRGGYKINHITVHHMAGVLTAAQCGSIFAKAGRGGSAHYGVGSDGKVGLYVYESDRAWSDSNWQSNCTAVSIETSNSPTGGNWPVSDLTFNKLVELVADIAKRNGLGTLVPGKNLTWHSMYAATTCVPIDTEVLTKNGWKSIHDVEEGEDIATAHIDDLSINFSPVLAKVPEKKQDTWETRGVEVTADHRMLWKTQGQDYWRVSQFKDLPNNASIYIPNAGKYTGAGIPLSDDEIRLLVAVQADGHYEHGDHSGKDRVTFHVSKERKIALLDDILSKYEHNKYLHADGTVSYNVHGIKPLCDRWLEDKKFTFEWLEMSPTQAEFFLDTLLDFDGCRAGNDYSSYAKQNIDVVDAVAAINGVGVRHNGDRRTAFVEDARTITKESDKKRHQQTIVSCVTVASGFILIRQHGRTAIVGNCPGDYLRGKMQELANRANAINNGEQFNPSYCDGFLPYPNGYWTKGDQNERIAVLAKWMRAKYPDFTPEAALGDYYGDNIAGAVKRYQELNGLEADGNVGPITYSSLKANGFTYPNPIYPPTKPTWTDISPLVLETAGAVDLYDVTSGAVVSSYREGVEVTVVQETTWDGVKYYRTQWSKDKNLDNGFKATDLREPAEPEPEPTPEPTPEPEPEPEDPTVGILEKIIAFIKHIIELITKKKED